MVDFSLYDISSSQGMLTDFAVNADSSVFTIIFTPMPVTVGEVSLQIAGGSYRDLATNDGIAFDADAGLTVHYSAPTPSLTAVQHHVSGLRAGQADSLTFSFSGTVEGFDLDDINSGQGTFSALVANDHSSIFTATTDIAGSPQLSVNSAGYTDDEGQQGEDWNSAAVDMASSTVRDMFTMTLSETALITFSFSESVADFSLADISSAQGTLSNFSANANQTVFTVHFSPNAGTKGLKWEG